MTKNKFASEAKGDVCVWQDDVEGYWAGNCGIHWCLEEGTPKENGMNFCPRCGKRLVQKGDRNERD
jgi:hypothetical protein